jgi:hypothetical protein
MRGVTVAMLDVLQHGVIFRTRIDLRVLDSCWTPARQRWEA